jgi:hypothetical protein
VVQLSRYYARLCACSVAQNAAWVVAPRSVVHSRHGASCKRDILASGLHVRNPSDPVMSCIAAARRSTVAARPSSLSRECGGSAAVGCAIKGVCMAASGIHVQLLI